MATKKTQPKSAQTAAVNTNSISLRGNQFIGRVVSDKAHRTVSVQWNWRRYVPKYERYEKKQSKVSAHNPDHINAKEGDLVRIQETRPLSKTKHFMVVEILEEAQQ